MLVGGRGAPRTRGLTLLELLLVVFLLAALAASAVSLSADVDVQSRYDVSVSRREQVREGILGPERSVQGKPLVSGFVADMGRLPTSLRELLEPQDDLGNALAPWEYDTTLGVGAGWRGPYVTSTLQALGSTTRAVFRDGWGNVDSNSAQEALNFGWLVDTTTHAESFDLVSLGRDGEIKGTSAPDREVPTYPSATPPPMGTRELPEAHEVLVPSDRWRVNIQGWQVALTLKNPDATSAFPATTLRLRLLLPKVNATSVDWTVPSPWPTTAAARDALQDVSLALSAPAIPARDLTATPPETGEQTVTFSFADPPAGALERWVPAGAWAFEVVRDDTGERVAPGNVLPVILIPRSALPDMTSTPLTWTVQP